MTTNPEGLHEALNREAEGLRRLAAVIRNHGVCAPMAVEEMADRIAALAASINPVAVDSTVIGGAAAAGREAVIAELIEAATAAQGDGVDRVVACHGYKCRELNCASCFGEDAAAQYVDAARVRAHRLSAAIDAARASTPEANDEPR